MTTIEDMPNEILLEIFLEASLSVKALVRLSMTCRHFRSLFKASESILAKKIAAIHYPAAYAVLGFGGRVSCIPRVLTLRGWSSQSAEVVSWCDQMRQEFSVGENAFKRPMWYTPLWEEHLYVGLLLFKKLSSLGSIMNRQQQLPGPFHLLLRFTSMVVYDMLHSHNALAKGDTGRQSIINFWQSGLAPGESDPSQQIDNYWAVVEIVLFEQGYHALFQLTKRSEARIGRRALNPLESSSILGLVESNRLPQHRRYHLALDYLCKANGRAYGGPDYWKNFDPFGLKDRGLSGIAATMEMVKGLPDW